MKWFHHRIHESVAFASVFAASITMQVAWIASVLVYRSAVITDLLTRQVDLGPISGLYLLSIATFFVFWMLTLLLVRGRDLSHWRDRIFWFFVTSVILFLIMTMPVVYQVGVVVSNTP